MNLRPARCRKFWMTRRRTLRGPPTVTPTYVRQLIEAGEKYVPYYERFPETSLSQQVLNSLSNSDGAQYRTVLDSRLITSRAYETLGEINELPVAEQPLPSGGTYQPQIPYYAPPSQPTYQPPVDPLTTLLAAKAAFFHSLLGLGRKKRSTPNVSDKSKIIGNF